MTISTKTRYGTRFMVYLADFYSIRTVSLKEVAESENVSLKYLSQIVIPLKNSGMIISIRGNNGGYSLAKAPSEINFLEIVNVLEGGAQVVDCVSNPAVCEESNSCRVKDLWMGLSKVIDTYLSNITLEDYMKKSDEDILNYSI